MLVAISVGPQGDVEGGGEGGLGETREEHRQRFHTLQVCFLNLNIIQDNEHLLSKVIGQAAHLEQRGVHAAEELQL